MEIRIDAADGQGTPPSDLFISMRIGDMQKQSRFTNSRTFRFPENADGKGTFGRVELFKRVGHATVGLEGLGNGGLQELKVPVSFGDLAFEQSNYNLRIAMNNKGASADQQKASAAAKKTRAKARMDAAQKYLQEHRLEELLAETMREVINDKPADPRRYISEKILSIMATGEIEKAALSPPVSPTTSPDSKAPKKAIFSNFGDYYSSNFASVSFDNLYAKFPKPAAPVPKPAAQVKSAAPAASFAFKPSVGSWCQRRLKAAVPAVAATTPSCSSLTEFPAYYQANFHVVPPAALQGLYSKFAKSSKSSSSAPPPVAPKPALKEGSAMPAPKATAPDVAPPAAQPTFKFKPSVGSWLQAKPAAASAKQPAADSAQFKFKPSVGSWLQARPKVAAPQKAAPACASLADFPGYYQANFHVVPTAALQGLYGKFAKSSKSSSSAPPPVAPKPAPKEGSAMPAPKATAPDVAPPAAQPAFTFKPSVGSWLQAKPAHHMKPAVDAVLATNRMAHAAEQSAGAQFKFKPSVGSWYTRRLITPAPAASAAAAKQEFKMLPSVGSWLAKAPPRVAPAAAVPAPKEAAQAAVPDITTMKFEDFDKNGDGVISKDEWNTMMSTLKKPPAAAEPPAATSSLKDFRAYYQVNFRSVHPSSMQGLYGKFAKSSSSAAPPPVAPKPAPKEGSAPAPMKSAAPEAAAPAQPAAQPAFKFKPSVGSWLQAKPAAAAASASAAQPAFKFKPSVGSWLQTRPAAAVAPQAAAGAAQKAATPFQMKPSVGSWLSPRSSKAAAPAAKAAGKAVSSLANFTAYYEANMRVVPSAGLQGLYGKFGSKSRSSAAPAAKAAGKAVSSLANFSAYYEANMRVVPSAGLQGLYGKFGSKSSSSAAPPPVAPKPAPKEGAAPAPLKAAAPQAAQRAAAFKFKPSVGSWLQKPVASKAAAPSAPACSSLADFGAYYQSNFRMVNPAALGGLYGKFAKSKPAASSSAPAPAPKEKASHPPFEELVPALLSGTVGADAVMIADHESAVELVEAFKAEIDKKDEEIRDLKHKLGMQA